MIRAESEGKPMGPVLVSVIIPVYNGAKFVAGAVESVLEQTYKDVEIIVVDDGSTDNTRAVLKPYTESGSVKYVYQENKGLASARNTGILHAAGAYLKFLDCDDILYSDQLRLQVDHLRNKDESIISVTNFDIDFGNNEKRSVDVWLGGDNQLARFIQGNPLPVHTPLVHINVIKKLGQFSEELKCSEDADYWMRFLLSGGKFEKISYVGCSYKMITDSLSDSESRMFPARVVYRERLNHFIEPRITELDRNTLNELLAANYRLIQTCFLRKVNVTCKASVTLRVTRAVYLLNASLIRKLLVKTLGLRMIIRLNFLKNRIVRPEYKRELLDAHVQWRKQESYAAVKL